MSHIARTQRAGPASPAQTGLAELFPELHGLIARGALSVEDGSLEAWQRLRLVNKAWHDGLQGGAISLRLMLGGGCPGQHDWPTVAAPYDCRHALSREAEVR